MYTYLGSDEVVWLAQYIYIYIYTYLGSDEVVWLARYIYIYTWVVMKWCG